MCFILRVAMAACFYLIQATALMAEETRVGSKAFTESVILGEIVSQLVRQSGGKVIHHRQLGGTRILWEAVKAGEIDIYPEYTGTLNIEILAGKSLETDEEREKFLDSLGLKMGGVLGFNNTYAIAGESYFNNIKDTLKGFEKSH